MVLHIFTPWLRGPSQKAVMKQGWIEVQEVGTSWRLCRQAMKKLKLQPESREWGLLRRLDCNLPLLDSSTNRAGGCSQQGKLRFAPVMGTALLGDPVKAKGKVRQTLQLLGTWENCLRTPRKQERHRRVLHSQGMFF